MAQSTIEYTKAAQDKTIEAIKQGQAVLVEAVTAWAEAAQKAVPALPALPQLPELPKGVIPSADEVVKTSFDFYAEVLEANRKFANDVLAAAAPALDRKATASK